jgi:16S rRNA processing protein RimM
VREPTERRELLEPGREVEIGGRVRTIAARKGTDERPLLKLEDVVDRNAAEDLHGQELSVPREALGALAEGEYLVDDLVGCAVMCDGLTIGRVADVLLLPAADVLEVERDGAARLLVPLVRDAIRSVDVTGGTIEVDTGFLDAD